MVFPFSGAPDTPAGSPDNSVDPVIAARDRLLRKINAKADLPVLGSSVSRVVQMASSNDEAVHNLAHFILRDVALTQKILRIANTVSYRTVSGTMVTTVSKAIFLLGFDTVKTSALAMLLVDGMASKHAESVRGELAQALSASLIGREMARISQFKDAEEAAIASLFKNFGRLLVASHDHSLYCDIGKLVEGGKHTPVQAAMEVLGCSFDHIGEVVLRKWNIPETIVQVLVPPAQGVLKLARSRQEWLQQVAAFSSAAARLIPGMNEPDQDAAIRAVLVRFGAALNIDHAKLMQLLEIVAQETRLLATDTELAAHFDVPAQIREDTALLQGGAQDALAPVQAVLPTELSQHVMESAPQLHVTERDASGKPLNARDLLLTGVQDVMQMMASGRTNVNDLMLLVLETLQGSLGFGFATVCLKDMQTQTYRARISLGEDNVERQSDFAFGAGSLASGRDLFQLALENNVDLMITDASVPKIRNLVPAWHRKLRPDARSFIVLPLVVQNKHLGIFYADRSQAAAAPIPADETALIKTLKGQVLAALQAR